MNAKYTRTAAALAGGNVQGARDILEALVKPAPPPPPGLPVENSSRSRRPSGAR